MLIALLLAVAEPPLVEAYLPVCGETLPGVTCNCLARRLDMSAPGRFWMEAQVRRALPEAERSAALDGLRRAAGVKDGDAPAFADAARAAYDAAFSDCQ